MKNVMIKLIASLLSLLVAAALAVVASFAWFTISAEPEVGGIEIRIGGGTTIMIAADVVVHNADGTVSHYPGKFSQNLNFADSETYSYLPQIVDLTPVSTADGVHWILADYYTAEDPEVLQGSAVVGQLKETGKLPVDTDLLAANQTSQQSGSKKGNFVYVDFWVVSPGDDYELRVSTGDDSGTFLIDRMEAVQEGQSYELKQGDITAAASARVGFLVNEDWSPYRDLQLYLGSDAYDDRYTHMRGSYQEAGETIENFSAATNRFTIYEPNGDLHVDGSDDYWITKPLGWFDGNIYPTDISDRLTVQLTNHWKTAPQSEQTMLEQEFATAIVGKSGFISPEQVMEYFYGERLQGNLSAYVDRGQFVTSTGNLYADANLNGVVDADSVVLHMTGGATEDVYITTLQKNIPQRIRMFIWLEGQDADCVNHETVSGFILSLELAGS